MTDLGKNAPDFTLPSTDGAPVTLSALRPKTVVLFFYPRDNTPGCTTEAKDFSQLKADFEAAGAIVLGISADSLASHEKFIAKQELTIPLLSDENNEVCAQFGVWKEKKMYGKTFWGIERTSFVIDGDGQIVASWHKVKVPGHAQAVLTAVQNL